MDKNQRIYDLWRFFFNEDGVFVWRKMPTGLEQAVIANDDILQSIVVSKSTSCSYWWFEFSKCRKL